MLLMERRDINDCTRVAAGRRDVTVCGGTDEKQILFRGDARPWIVRIDARNDLRVIVAGKKTIQIPSLLSPCAFQRQSRYSSVLSVQGKSAATVCAGSK